MFISILVIIVAKNHGKALLQLQKEKGLQIYSQQEIENQRKG